MVCGKMRFDSHPIRARLEPKPSVIKSVWNCANTDEEASEEELDQAFLAYGQPVLESCSNMEDLIQVEEMDEDHGENPLYEYVFLDTGQLLTDYAPGFAREFFTYFYPPAGG